VEGRKDKHIMVKSMALALLFFSTASFAVASNVAPEINGSSAVAAVGLLSGGILVLRGRRKR
jgi:hypothetical protein